MVARVGSAAKSRLAGTLSVDQRHSLALAMLGDVLSVCHQAHYRSLGQGRDGTLATDGPDAIAGTLAVIDEAAARAVALHNGAIAIADPGRGDMNAAVTVGIAAARARGAGTVLILPGDVPLISTDDLQALLDSAGQAPRVVVVGASQDAQGTNALLLRPPDVIAPAFGPPSVGRHVRAGLAAGAHTVVRAGLGLALDVDTPDDLARLQTAAPGPHTAAALAQLSLRQSVRI
ncbi:MAG: 2-phospho-L-lactate/phosphoenolpyruvate guanylyltransferase [Myxococcales bacterium]|nr:2-phospho-L-lactate/phosphoenolpyruvate guanylyltransferase [Myxococcales bacterium]